jgi:hypothetical protein
VTSHGIGWNRASRDRFAILFHLFPTLQDLTLKLTRSKDGFLLLAPTAVTHKVVISSIKLHVRYVELHDEVHDKLMKQLVSKPMLLPFTRTQIKLVTLTSGIQIKNIVSAFQGVLPRCLVIGFVRSEALANSVKLNPYNFQNFDLNKICLKVNGLSVPSTPFEPDFGSNMCMLEYRNCSDSLGFLTSDLGNLMTFEQFKEGMTLFPFDLNPESGCASFHSHIMDSTQGNIDVELSFKTALTNTITVVMFATTESSLYLYGDGSQQVIVGE